MYLGAKITHFSEPLAKEGGKVYFWTKKHIKLKNQCDILAEFRIFAAQLKMTEYYEDFL